MSTHASPDPFVETLEWLQEPNALVALDRELVRRGGFKEFVKLAWHIIEPGTPYADNWHLDVFIAHLERVSKGDLKRFAAGIPPRHGKSSILSCLWCAWDWIDNPQRRFIFASYDFSLAVRDSVRTRRVIQSAWYQARWGHRFSIRADENQKGKFENDHTGYRDTMSVGSAKSTGFGADIICFPADEIVRTEHGPRRIGDLVENREAVRVWSYNKATGATELKPITGWHRNPASPLVKMTLSDGATIRCTPGHEFWTRRGMVQVDQLLVVDMLPYPTVPDIVDRPGRDAELLREAPLSKPRLADHPHNLFSDLRLVVRHATRPVAALARAFRNRLPCLAAPNLADCTGAHSVPSRQRLQGIAAVRDLKRLLTSKLRARPVFEKRKRAMPLRIGDVLRACAIGEVVQRAMRVIAIEMPNFLAISRRSNKGEHHHLVDEQMVRAPVTPGVEPAVAAFAGRKFQDALGHRNNVARPATGIVADGGASVAFHPPEIGHGIAGETRYRSPLLVENCGHADVTYCLTVADNHTMLVGDITQCAVVASNCVDDPHSVKNVESEASRAGTLQWWNEVMQSRLNDPKTGAFVVVHQRVHAKDVIGDILARHGDEYEYLCLPARFDPAHPNRWSGDPRSEPGELLWPQHIDEATLGRFEHSMGQYAFSAQFQQLAVPRDGGMFKRHWFRFIKPHEVPADCRFCRGWDLAATAKQLVKGDPDYTATVKFGWSPSRKQWYVVHVNRWREDPDEVERLIVWHAIEDKRQSGETMTVVPKDPGQAGKSQSRHLMQLLGGFNAFAEPQTGSKEIRAWPLAGQAGIGNILIVEAEWNEMFLAELCGFPTFAHDDMFDAAATAFTRLANNSSSGIEEFYSMLENETPAKPTPQSMIEAETNKFISNFDSLNRR